MPVHFCGKAGFSVPFPFISLQTDLLQAAQSREADTLHREHKHPVNLLVPRTST